jgi:hypothetical protein
MTNTSTSPSTTARSCEEGNGHGDPSTDNTTTCASPTTTAAAAATSTTSTTRGRQDDHEELLQVVTAEEGALSACSSSTSSNHFSSGSLSSPRQHRRSLELRKLPMDTSLFRKSSSRRRGNVNVNANANVNANVIAPEAPMMMMDNSDDNTHTTLEPQEEDQHSPTVNSNNTNNNNDVNNNDKSPSKLKFQESLARWCLRSTCLKSTYSLQSQLLLSFGIVSSLTITITMAICVAVALASGNAVHDLARQSLQQLSQEMQGTMVRYMAESLSTQILPGGNHNNDSLLQLLQDAMVDRFVGYPDYPGYENDTLTPFKNVYTQIPTYPVVGPPATVDWLLTPSLDDQEKYGPDAKITTAHAVYTFQGTCNPQASVGDYDYYPDCSYANNDVITGGVVRPTETNAHLYWRASDMTPLLKAVYEATPALLDVGICFANAGAGSCLVFPGRTINGTLAYTSQGCD